MKKFAKLLIMFCAVFALAVPSVTAFAEEDYVVGTDGTKYAATDVEVVNEIIKSIPNGEETYGLEPADWNEKGLVTWWGETTNSIWHVTTLWLDCKDCHGTLDVSALEGLRTVTCNLNPELTEIILPDSDTFEYISCNTTGITELDVSKVPGLLCLYCNNTNLSVLDVSNNPMLMGLSFFGTGVKTIDLSKNSELKSVGVNESIEKLVTPKGNVITIVPAENGTISTLYDVVSEMLIVIAFEAEGYEFVCWNGLPADVEATEIDAYVPIEGDMTISAVFQAVEDDQDENDDQDKNDDQDEKGDQDKNDDQNEKDDGDSEDITEESDSESPNTGETLPVQSLTVVLLAAAVVVLTATRKKVQ